MRAIVAGARLAPVRLIEMATEVFGTAPAQGRVAGPEAWIALPFDASVHGIDELATRVGGCGLIIFESSCSTSDNTLSVTTYIAPGRDDEFDVTESAVALLDASAREGNNRLDDAASAHELAWRLATESWEIALARHLVSSGMIELRVMWLPVTALALELGRGKPVTDREWEQLGERLREQLSSSKDVDIPKSIDHTFFAAAARKTMPH